MTADLIAVGTAAAATIDPDVVELAETTEQRRIAGARSVIDSVRAVARLRPGLTRDHAVDVLSLLNSPAVFAHLVRGARWTLDQYQTWLADALVRELLGQDQQPETTRRTLQAPATRRAR